TALTFWGSTSALGGTTNNAHLYKAIPRFINGILMVHIPARTYHEEARESAKNTPSGSLSGSVGSGGANSLDVEIQEKWNERREKVGSIHSLVDITVELQELIPLPDDVVDLILKNFWEQFHPQFPLIDKIWFDAQLKSLRSLPYINIELHWRFILLLTSVLALMVNFSPSLSIWENIVLKHLLDSYKKILFDHFEIADVIMVQSLLFIVLMGGCARGVRFTGTWGYMGIAVRLAQELGLHRSVKELGVLHRTFTKESIAIRNRTWHCVMIMETYTCIWTGRPLAIHDSDWDAEYPEATTPETTTLRHHIDLAIIIAKILRFANRAQPSDVNMFASTIKASLDAWWSALDDDWRSLIFQERWNSKALMALMYHSATILFYRTAYCRIDQPACLEAASAITKLVSRFEAPPSTNECI
ncbi:UNVERIFIED_CONTAM: hypothetical protein HDU68_006895, partial [Siphonaria sp. JEL0065]